MPVLDTRSHAAFLAAHLPDAVNIPLEELAARVHELPASAVSISVTDADAGRLAKSAEFLRQRGHSVHVFPFDPSAQIASGLSQSRLWQPNPFLIQSLDLIRPKQHSTAIDVACGTGRDSVYLAMRGYNVTAIDLLPDALDRVNDLSARYNTSLKTLVHDLEKSHTIPVAPADLVCVFRYLHRPLWPALRGAVLPGGHLIYETFHERNLQTGRSPRSPGHLLQTGELSRAFADFEILIAADAVERDERFFSHLLARRPGA